LIPPKPIFHGSLELQIENFLGFTYVKQYFAPGKLKQQNDSKLFNIPFFGQEKPAYNTLIPSSLE
jgi:hypothetical protein